MGYLRLQAGNPQEKHNPILHSDLHSDLHSERTGLASFPPLSSPQDSTQAGPSPPPLRFETFCPGTFSAARGEKKWASLMPCQISLIQTTITHHVGTVIAVSLRWVLGDAKPDPPLRCGMVSTWHTETGGQWGTGTWGGAGTTWHLATRNSGAHLFRQPGF